LPIFFNYFTNSVFIRTFAGTNQINSLLWTSKKLQMLMFH
jgi:hypothetical protein